MKLGGQTSDRSLAPEDHVTDPADAPREADGRSDRGGEAGDTTPRADAGDLAPGDRRALRRAWSLGAVPTVAAFVWLIMAGRWAPLQRQFFDDFFDAQARAFLHGRWDIPQGAAGFEGFVVDGRTYIYFGPFPALLRVPLLLITDRFDGRLTTISMVAAIVVVAVAGHHLNLAVRALVRSGAPVGRGEKLATTALAVAVVAGIPLWLGSTASVFHEAILWGVAMTVAALAAAVRWIVRPTGWRLVATAALASAAMASRQPLGVALLAGLGLIAAVVAVDRLVARRRGRPPAVLDEVRLGGLLLACVVIGLVAVVPNIAKFGNPFSPSIEDHIASEVLPSRREYLAANDGKYFRPRFIPTTLWQYSRPDALDLRADFPWVDFPPGGPTVIGDAVFDELEWSSSVPVTMPALVVLAVPGVVWLVRAARRRQRGLGALALWVGTFAGAPAALTIGYVGHRYMGDLVPIVLLPGVVGLQALLGRTWSARAARRAVGAGLAVLVAFGAWTNLALGIEYQRERGFNIPEQWRAELVRWRADLPGTLRGVIHVAPTDRELPPAEDGTYAVVGDCLGLYLRVGDSWWGVSRGPGVGVFDLRVDLDALDDLGPGRRAPLATFVDGDEVRVLTLVRLADGQVRADHWLAGEDTWSIGWPAEVGGEVALRIDADPRSSEQFLTVGRTDLPFSPPWSTTTEVTFGRAPAGVDVARTVDAYPGEVEPLPYDPSLCREVSGTSPAP